MQDTIKEIINAHNAMVEHLKTLQPEVHLFWGLELWYKVDCEATKIVKLAGGVI